MKLKTLCAALMLAAAAAPASAVSFINGITIPGATGDQYGSSVNDGRLGMFSDIYYDPNRNEWWGLSDRGPGGGTLAYDVRVQRFTLDVDKSTGAISNFQVVQTIKFSAGGVTMGGQFPSTLSGSASNLGTAFDPEGIVINPHTGTLLVSDEYGPSLYEFDRNGNLLRAYNTPEALRPALNAGGYNYDGDGNVGRRTNRGFEGLAISPDGQYTYAMLQSAMVDEGGANGVYNRIVKFDNTSGEAVAQYAYKMETAAQGRGISALVALNDHEFAVLERNNRGLGADAVLDGAAGNKNVYLIDLTGATDVTGMDLDAAGASFTAVSKNSTPFIDLAANALPETGGLSPEKWEGLAIGPQLDDGSWLIVAGNDNDYSVTQNGSAVQFDVLFNPATQQRIQCPLGSTEGCTLHGSTTPYAGSTEGFELIPGVLYAYRATGAELGYTPPVPEPAGWALLGAGLALVAGVSRRKS
ncbi:esterase-like activity of phytase family protein [Methyloversatilis thermotolerans]|uniref:esterase-like activity of phytase family protein n=1 Tax=Methyloversatilis thermotolerans TaxID=1346290 RepID=UPI00036966C8|nr:esterase-like activity of phytase family protein [Methyloversatilis thermotolerans]